MELNILPAPIQLLYKIIGCDHPSVWSSVSLVCQWYPALHPNPGCTINIVNILTPCLETVWIWMGKTCFYLPSTFGQNARTPAIVILWDQWSMPSGSLLLPSGTVTSQRYIWHPFYWSFKRPLKSGFVPRPIVIFLLSWLLLLLWLLLEQDAMLCYVLYCKPPPVFWSGWPLLSNNN